MKKLTFFLMMLLGVAVTSTAQGIRRAEGGSLPRNVSTLPGRSTVFTYHPSGTGYEREEQARGKFDRMARVTTSKVLERRRVSETETAITYQCSVVLTNGTTKYWSATYIFDTDNKTVTIQNFLSGLSGYKEMDVKGRLDDGKIIIPTGIPSKDPDNTTYLYKWSDDTYLFLAAGETEEDENGYTILTSEEQLVMYVSDDYETITSGGKTVAIISCDSYYGSNLYKWTVPTYQRVPDDVKAVVSGDDLDFGKMLYMKRKNMPVTITSFGGKPLDFTVTSTNPAFVTDIAEGHLELFESATVNVTFAPDAVGVYEGQLDFEYDGQQTSVLLHGEAAEIDRDFSALIVEGDKGFFAWKNESEHPWVLEGNAAVADNERYNGDGLLEGAYDSERDVLLTMHIDEDNYFKDTLIVAVDDIPLLKYSTTFNDDFSCVLPAGKHVMTWNLRRDGNSYKDTNHTVLSSFRIKDTASWASFSPDGSIGDVQGTGWMNLNGMAVATTDGASLILPVMADGASNISFRAKAAGGNTIDVTVDGEQVAAIDADTLFHTDLAAGSHTVTLTARYQTASDSTLTVSDASLSAGGYMMQRHTYLALGDSGFDKDGQFNPADGLKGVCFPVEIAYDNAGRFTIQGLFPHEELYTLHYEIPGRMADGTVSIPAKKNFNTGTRLGTIPSETYTYVYWLEAGDMKVKDVLEEEGTWQLTTADDGQTFVSANGAAIHRTWSFYDYRYVDFYGPGVRFMQAKDEATLALSSDCLDMGYAFIGTGAIELPFTIANIGKTDAAISIEQLSGQGDFSLGVEASSIEALGSIQPVVTFCPSTAGTKEALFRIVSGHQELTLTVRAEAYEKPDYQSIVTEGAELITGWNTSANYPWIVADGKAKTTNGGHNSSTGTLEMNLTVPAGKAVHFTSLVEANTEPGSDYLSIDVNGSPIAQYYMRYDHAVAQCSLGEGDHKLTFSMIKDDKNLIPSKDTCAIWDVRLEMFDAEKAVYPLQPYYFVDREVPVGIPTKIEATIGNATSRAIHFTHASVDAPFTVENGDITIQPGKAAKVNVILNAQEPGLYKTQVALEGEDASVSFDVEAQAGYVRYLGGEENYTDIFLYNVDDAVFGLAPLYNWSLYWGSEMEGLRGCELTDITFFTYYQADCLFDNEDVEYLVGETDAEKITDINAPDAQSVYRGPQMPVSNYEQTIHFNEPYLYRGGNFAVECRSFARDYIPYLVFFLCSENNGAHGMTSVYDTSMGQYVYSTVPYARVRYVPAATGITQKADRKVKRVDYYDLSGNRLAMPTKGVNIVVTTYDDGTSVSTKAVQNMR